MYFISLGWVSVGAWILGMSVWLALWREDGSWLNGRVFLIMGISIPMAEMVNQVSSSHSE